MISTQQPLAERMRPSKLEDLIGQEHLVGENGIIRKAIQSGNVPSMILWGPPGVGKTTIANIIANEVKRPFHMLSAVSAGVKDVRDVIDQARRASRVILFIDEIHRFNKSQQDALLGAVEKGVITLIGATTENPSFEVNSALLSRCQVYTLKALTQDDLIRLLNQALAKDVELKKRKINIKEFQALINISGGDARKLLNLLEIISESVADDVPVTDEIVMNIAQKHIAIYDKSGEQHYDIISAFIKSIRGSDPNAAVYYLARMIEGGEDVKFIARRMVILASEDIGNANPTALVMATTTFQAVNIIGYPEARIILSQCARFIWLARLKVMQVTWLSKKRWALLKKLEILPVPLAIRNAPTKLMKDLDYGKGYQYAHDFRNNFVAMEFLPDTIKETKFYEPGKNTREEELRNYLKKLWDKKYNY
jgi:putative ATPase